ncbi:MAG TPA: hypothetical protein VNO34_03370 [Actinomycetota bacterium]|nr:hypothetical protein [Actinomycetota bacterium]
MGEWSRRPDPPFQARCAWCGEVDLEREDLEVHVGSGSEALVEFSCPACGRLNARRLEPEDVVELAAAGVGPASGPAPFELLEERSGPPIGWDDLIEFHERIARHGLRAADAARPRAARGGRERDAA